MAHRGELQAAHERCIKHYAGYDRHDKQQTHEGQQQLAGQAGKHVHVQAQHGHHETTVGRGHFHRFAGAAIKHEGVR
ncbi:hypothetical protein D3C76_1702670 [compost metagenome]